MRATCGRMVVVAAWAVALGFGATVSVAEIDVAAVRGGVLLAEEPAGAISIADAKAKLGPTPQPVVVAGRIGGKGTSPFGRNEATFSMLEIPTDDHAAKPGHKAEDCPFCKKRTANSPIAAVSFAGTDGRVIAVDAQKLLGVAEGQDVVVRGQGFFDPKLGIPLIQINADGLYIRKAK
jgi:hypothetical protein